jgi:hypothetical protein
MSQLSIVREQHKRKYELLQKIKSKIEFDKTTRSAYRILNFFRKFRIKPINQIPEDIPSKYRFRFFGYSNPLLEYMLEQYNETIDRIVSNTLLDSDAKSYSANEEVNKLDSTIKYSYLTVKLPIIIDIRNSKYQKGNIISVKDIDVKIYIDMATQRKLQKIKKHINMV